MQPFTSRNINLLAQISCWLLVCSSKSHLIKYAKLQIHDNIACRDYLGHDVININICFSCCKFAYFYTCIHAVVAYGTSTHVNVQVDRYMQVTKASVRCYKSLEKSILGIASHTCYI